MADRDRPHIVVRARALAEEYTHGAGGDGDAQGPAPTDRPGHARRLLDSLTAAERLGQERRRRSDLAVEGATPGIYLTFESFPGLELALESLDPRAGSVHPELVAVRERSTDDGPVQMATVFVPDGRLGVFTKKIEKYAETASAEKPRHHRLIDPVAEVSLASLRELWTDGRAEFPGPGVLAWWEVWLRRRDGNELTRLTEFATATGCRLGESRLGFADRTVVLVQATPEQLATAIDVLDDLSELRRPHEPGALLARESSVDQAEWVSGLASRVSAADMLGAPAVCVLDTGVHQGHPLISPSLDPQDQHTCHPQWGGGDHLGHGTEMAGLAVYGDVAQAVTGAGPLRLRHRLESVKILPPPPRANPPEMYGAITATASSLVEIQAPHRRRVYSLAVTAPTGSEQATGGRVQLGQPTSWSAAIDALAAGRAIDTTTAGLVYLDEETTEPRPRLFIISAGNVPATSFCDDYLDRCDTEPVEDPAQAWNALTVGACTELHDLSHETGYQGWTALAPPGDLSPHSRTSGTFSRGLPTKPDIVLEGGNAARSPGGTSFDTPESLQLLTTKALLNDSRLLTVTCATSAATAQAAHLSAQVMAEYPGLWPETVRGMVVHSAEWTPAMRSHLPPRSRRTFRDVDLLRRRYGMGVPSLARATRSAKDDLTLLVQDVIHPFDGQGRMREMHLHDLPWPGDVLADLGETEVRMRVTLSYFVEPNPARRGWSGRFSYASHGLRFDLRRATESTQEFRKRLNDKALDEEERRPPSQDESGAWTLGTRARSTGSLHCDIWTGTAIDLSRRGMVAVFPVSGWWKTNTTRDRSERGVRYALVISIEAPDQDVDIWTPVAQQVGVPIEIGTA